MIRFTNGHTFRYVVASGALAFDGKGYFWEWPLRWCGLIQPNLFTVFIKTLTRQPRKGNLRWSRPWECVRLIRGGSVNKVGLTNPGIDWWCRKIGPNVSSEKIALAGSIYGSDQELIEMAIMLNDFDLVGLEVNPSCPNTGRGMQEAAHVLQSVTMVKDVSRHPVVVKVSVAQDYVAIGRGLTGIAEAISLNSVPWEIAFPHNFRHRRARSPLWRLEKKMGGGGGGVSGKPAQRYNWEAVRRLAREVPSLPVIASSIMEYENLEVVRRLGASAFSFGAIHLRTPWEPTQIVMHDMKVRSLEAREFDDLELFLERTTDGEHDYDQAAG